MNYSPLYPLLTAHAIAYLPNESCGYIIRDRTSLAYLFVPCDNIHQEPIDNFAISEFDYTKADKLGEIVALFHSHVKATIENGKCDFSSADRVACEQSDIDWILCTLPQQEIKILRPSGYKLPLLEREFVYGLTDCYALVRDAFAEIGIELSDYPRGNVGEWDGKADWNMFEDNFQSEDFVVIDKHSVLQKYDVLLMQIQSSKINHIGLMWEPDRNIFIHHLIDRLSELSIFGGFWERCTIKIVRHKNLCP
jgi:proteasome lid subunit RPN8/RPN11